MTMPTTSRLPTHYVLFDTAIGTCGIAWSERGLTRLQLPESGRDATEQRLRANSAIRSPQAPPPAIDAVMASVQRYLTGRNVDFGPVVLDLRDVGPFHRRIYDAARSVGWGQTESYGALARLAGAPGAARAVGQALGRNPIPIIVPCHRILAKGRGLGDFRVGDFKLGGFSAYGGIATKERLLVLEGLRLV
jgi:methylated-DNA-[protein]-cysteine S-methyltransferase